MDWRLPYPTKGPQSTPCWLSDVKQRRRPAPRQQSPELGGAGQGRVAGDQGERVLPGQFQEAGILDQAGGFQLRKPALPRPQELSRAPETQVGLGDPEAVGR